LTDVVKLTDTEYDALETKDEKTLYLVKLGVEISWTKVTTAGPPFTLIGDANATTYTFSNGYYTSRFKVGKALSLDAVSYSMITAVNGTSITVDKTLSPNSVNVASCYVGIVSEPSTTDITKIYLGEQLLYADTPTRELWELGSEGKSSIQQPLYIDEWYDGGNYSKLTGSANTVTYAYDILDGLSMSMFTYLSLDSGETYGQIISINTSAKTITVDKTLSKNAVYSSRYMYARQQGGSLAINDNSVACGLGTIAGGRGSFTCGERCIVARNTQPGGFAIGNNTIAYQNSVAEGSYTRSFIGSHAEGVADYEGHSLHSRGTFSGTLGSASGWTFSGNEDELKKYTKIGDYIIIDPKRFLNNDFYRVSDIIGNTITLNRAPSGTGELKDAIFYNARYGAFSHSHSEGRSTIASGSYSHAEGHGTTAKNLTEHAEGHYNISNNAFGAYGNSGNTQHSVGIGTSEDAKRNAFEIMQNGDAYLYGVGGYDGTNPQNASTLQECVKTIIVIGTLSGTGDRRTFTPAPGQMALQDAVSAFVKGRRIMLNADGIRCIVTCCSNAKMAGANIVEGYDVIWE